MLTVGNEDRGMLGGEISHDILLLDLDVLAEGPAAGARLPLFRISSTSLHLQLPASKYLSQTHLDVTPTPQGALAVSHEKHSLLVTLVVSLNDVRGRPPSIDTRVTESCPNQMIGTPTGS
jgi:hypothetical protein